MENFKQYLEDTMDRLKQTADRFENGTIDNTEVIAQLIVICSRTLQILRENLKK